MTQAARDGTRASSGSQARWRRARVHAAAVLVAALQWGCSGDRAEDSPAATMARIEKGEAAAVAVELRVKLSQSPDDATLRYLFGRALLESGNAAAAEVELDKAMELGHAEHEVLLPLARALLAQQKEQTAINRLADKRLPDASATGELQALIAAAYRNVGRVDDAQQTAEAALRSRPGYAPATLVLASLMAARGDEAGALRTVGQVLQSDAKNLQAWILQGQLQEGQRRVDEAIASYRKGLEVKADSVSAHAALIGLLLARDDVAAASAQWKAMKEALPNNPRTQLIEAKLALRAGDAKRARELINPLMRGASPSVELLQLASAVELTLGSRERARQHLLAATQRAPQYAVPRIMLAELLSSEGQHDEAQKLLEPLTRGDPADPVALSVLAKVRLMQGDARGADQLYARASKTAQGGALEADRTLARGRLDPTEGHLADLARLAQSSQESTADLALISAHLAAGRAAAARQALDTLQRKQPDSPLVDELRGRIALRQRNVTEARGHFERALEKAPSHYPALAGLAGIDLAQAKPDEAVKRFEQYLKVHPNHLQATMALAEAQLRRQGGTEAATAAFRQAVSAHALEPRAHLRLIDHMAAMGNTEGALVAARAAAVALPDNADVLKALASAQRASNGHAQALETYARLAALVPNAAEPHLLAAETKLALKDLAGAKESSRRALRAEATSLPALRFAAALEVREKRFAEAMAFVRQAQQALPGGAEGLAMEAEVLLLEGKQAKAEEVLARCAPLANGGPCVRMLFGALNSRGRAAEAEKLALDHLRRHPEDTGVSHMLGDAALARKDWARAEQHYRRVTERRPLDVQALNNIAWAMSRQGKAGAVAMAERAMALSPRNAIVMDTLAQSLAAEKQLDKALQTQRKAVELAPNIGSLRMNLARLYIANGDPTKARVELERLKTGAENHQLRNDAQALLSKLGAGA